MAILIQRQEDCYANNQALADGQLAVAAITLGEIVMLIDKKQLEFHIELDIWRRDLLRDGSQEILLTV